MSDWNNFKEDMWWSPYLHEGEKVLSEALAGAWSAPSAEFSSTFPTLSQLLKLARVTRVRIDGEERHLYGWTKANGDTLGWLCHPPGRTTDKPLHPLHVLLLSGFGGITERWNESQESWLLNHHSALVECDALVGQCEWDENYRHVCKLDGVEHVIDCKQYTSFAFEANGNFTSYHQQTAAVLMYAHDHCFDHIEPCEGCPEYTWYRIIDCPVFTTWVETVAGQWLSAVEDSLPDEPTLYQPPAPGLVLLSASDPAPGTMLYAGDGTPRYVFVSSGVHQFQVGSKRGLQVHEIGKPDDPYWMSYEVMASMLFVKAEE